MRIAAADLGSNSFHLLVVQAHSDGSFDTLVREKEMLRLGDVVSRTGRITDEAEQAVLACLRDFRALADSLGVDELVACATSAIREAENSAEVVDRIGEETGIDVRVISGHDEARLIFGAVRASVVLEPPPALCIDLGGGSLELVVGDAGGLQWADSVKLGVARLTSECVRSDPPDDEDQQRVRRLVDSTLDPLDADIRALGPNKLVGTSGTLCDLARMAALRAGADAERLATSVNQLTVARADLDAVHRQLLSLPALERAQLPGLEARRADLVVSGSMLLQAVMDRFGFDSLTVGAWALREGIVLDAISRHDPSDWSEDPRAMRHASVQSLSRRCQVDHGHARQVARLAVELFDRTRRFHQLPDGDRELLHHAAVLHDIGEHISVEGHHKHTAYLIQHGRLRGFAPDEIAMLASVGRFHRRGEPKASYEPFAALAPADRARVVALTALLRVADGLDRGHAAVVDRLDVEEVDDDHLRLVVHANGDAALERWGFRRKVALLERVLGRRVDCVLDERHSRGLAAELSGTG